jgi:hypothetical protein
MGAISFCSDLYLADSSGLKKVFLNRPKRPFGMGIGAALIGHRQNITFFVKIPWNGNSLLTPRKQTGDSVRCCLPFWKAANKKRIKYR